MQANYYVGLVWETLSYEVFRGPSVESILAGKVSKKYCGLSGPFATRAEAKAEAAKLTESERQAAERQFAHSYPHLS